MLADEEKNQPSMSKNGETFQEQKITTSPTATFYIATYFPFFDDNPECQISYEFCGTTMEEVQAMPANKQRHFVQTSICMTQRKCLKHMHTSCGECNFMNAFYKQNDNIQELPFSTQCQIEWISKPDGTSFDYKCNLHGDQPCFSCVHYSKHVRSKPTLPLLTKSTYDLFMDLHRPFVEVYKHDKPSLQELLFFIDHTHVDVPKDVQLLCKPMQVLFEQCNCNVEHFIVANAQFVKVEHLIGLGRDIKKLWDAFDRSVSVCCIKNCLCKQNT